MKSSKPNTGALVRVLLVDSDPAAGRRLVRLFEGACGFRLCGQAQDLAEAQRVMAAEAPDLLIVDTDLNRAAALQFFSSLAGVAQCRVLATSRHSDAAQAEQVLRTGISGFLLKTEPTHEILSAFRAVLRGQHYVSRAVAMPLLKRLLSERPRWARTGIESLTDRELRIFELLGLGLSKREVAARLGLSCKTVESHRAKIQHRLGLKSAADLAQCAFAWVQRGLPSDTAASYSRIIGERSGHLPL